MTPELPERRWDVMLGVWPRIPGHEYHSLHHGVWFQQGRRHAAGSTRPWEEPLALTAELGAWPVRLSVEGQGCGHLRLSLRAKLINMPSFPLSSSRNSGFCQQTCALCAHLEMGPQMIFMIHDL